MHPASVVPALSPAVRARRGSLYIIASALCMAPKPVLIHGLLAHGIDSTSLMELRFLVAAPLCLTLAVGALRADGRLPLRAVLGLVLLGVLGFAGAAWLDVIGLRTVSVRAERLLLGIAPTLVVLGTALVQRRPPGRRMLLALLLTYGGLAMTLPGGSHRGEDPRGLLCIAASAACWALYLGLSGIAIARWGARRTTAVAMTGACLAMLCSRGAHGLVGTCLPAPLIQPTILLPLLALGTIATVAPVVLLSRGIALIGPSRTAVLGTIGPVTTLLLGAAVLGERWDLRLVGGAACTLCGGLLVAVPRRAAAPLAQAPTTPRSSATPVSR